MKPKLNHQFVLEIISADSLTTFDQRSLDAFDWEPAKEAALLDAMRRGIAVPGAAGSGCTIEPRWDAEAGKPYIDGITARLPGIDAEGICPMNLYFSGAAKILASGLVEEGTLQKGDVYHYKVAAYPVAGENPGDPAAPREDDRFAVEAIEVAPPILEGVSLEEAAEGATILMDARHAEPADMPVYLPQRVLDEAVEQTGVVEGVETGGILIGNLYRSSAGGDLGIVISAQIPATETQQGATSLTFTPDTWAAVDGALKLRGGEEIMLGWWHSHPARAWCGAECPIENRLKCSLQRSFFSDDDKLLHRTIFPKAWSMGLLVTNADAGMKFSLWAWRDGAVQRRSFSILK